MVTGATASKVHLGATFRGGLDVWTAGVGGVMVVVGVWLEGQEEGRRGRSGLCGREAGGGGREEGEKEGRGQLTA